MLFYWLGFDSFGTWQWCLIKDVGKESAKPLDDGFKLLIVVDLNTTIEITLKQVSL